MEEYDGASYTQSTLKSTLLVNSIMFDENEFSYKLSN